jgi:hypothetical protein
MTDNLLSHELANLLPMIEGIKFAELKEDIRKNGILEPDDLSPGNSSKNG